MDHSKDSIRMVKKVLRMISTLVNQNHRKKYITSDYLQTGSRKGKGRGEHVMMQSKKNNNIILLRLIFKSKASVGIYFSCDTVTGLTSQLHSMLSNHIHSYSTGSHGFTEKTTTAPEERKPRVTALPHTHT